MDTDLYMDTDPYYIDDTMVEHGCCWDSAIVRKCKNGEGMYGGDVALICECYSGNAQMICDALNALIASENKPC